MRQRKLGGTPRCLPPAPVPSPTYPVPWRTWDELGPSPWGGFPAEGGHEPQPPTFAPLSCLNPAWRRNPKAPEG